MAESNSDFQITPETKIGAMLERFPQLENILIKMAPEFKKLRNPILLITPFLPVPLIDNAKEKGYLTWSREEPKGVFKTYLTTQA